MVEINLLPWRKHLRDWQIRTFKKMFMTSLVLAISTIATIHLFLIYQLANHNKHLLELQNSLDDHGFDNANDYLQYNVLLKNLSQYQLATQALIVALNNNAHQTVCFTAITRNKDGVVLTGKTRSLLDLMTYLNTFNVKNAFSEIQIASLVENSTGILHFKLRGVETNRALLALWNKNDGIV